MDGLTKSCVLCSIRRQQVYCNIVIISIYVSIFPGNSIFPILSQIGTNIIPYLTFMIKIFLNHTIHICFKLGPQCPKILVNNAKKNKQARYIRVIELLHCCLTPFLKKN